MSTTIADKQQIEKARIARRLKDRRIELRRRHGGYTQTDVAKALFVARVTYAAWEDGRATIAATDLGRISSVMKVPASYWIDDDAPAKFEDESAAEFYEGLPPDLKEGAKAMLRGLYEQAKARETTHGKKAE